MTRAATHHKHGRNARSIAVSLSFLVLLGACDGPEPGPQEQLRQWVSDSQQAVEDKQRRELVDMISPAYVDTRGNDRDGIEGMLRVYFFRQHSIELLTNIQEIRLYGDTAAEIDLTVGMAGTNEGVFGFSADAYRFQLELQRDDDVWLLISARWGEFGEELH